MTISLSKFRKTGVPGILGVVLLALVQASLGCGGEKKASVADVDRVLQASWRSYRQHFISPEGRVVIPERSGESISEAQAYALLRAVWAGDRDTFRRVYAWTWTNLGRQPGHGDALLAWRWGRGQDSRGQVLDWNTAADADLDYALALALAARRGWRPPPELPDFSGEARRVLEGVLALETVALPGGEILLTPGNWHEERPPYLVNPSYFSPAAYRLFGKIHPHPAWTRLRDSTYDQVARLAQGLAQQKGVGLFPDWCQADGQARFEPAPGRDALFGWEAVRLPWRLALDSLWFQEERATRLLARLVLPFFKKEWQARGGLAAVYSYGGEPQVSYESPVLYAAVLAAALAAGDRPFARQMAGKILSFYREEGEHAYFAAPDNYYANNWAWLGLALYAGWVKAEDFRN